MSDARVEARSVVVERDGVVLASLDALDVSAGETVALVGRNGAGKSTLLRALAGVASHTAGTIRIDGHELPRHRPAPAELTRRVTLALPRPWLFRGSVRANLVRALAAHAVPGAERVARCRRVVEQLDLAPLVDKDARALSSGESARVSLARALALETPVLLLDEPFAHLDPQAVPRAAAAIAERVSAGAAVVLAALDADELGGVPARVVQISPPGGRS